MLAMQTESSTLLSVYPLAAFQDNYIWCMAYVNQQTQQACCAVVDPGEAQPVLSELRRRDMTLSAILLTHHHADHVGGVMALKQAYPDVRVIGIESERIPGVNQAVTAGQQVSLPGLDLTFTVLDVPGHTRDHIAFYAKEMLFCGDTLFSVGCGRLFEGTPAQMHESLQTLAALPGDTRVYCAHEYTLANIQFALQVEPNNPQLVQYAAWAEQQRKQGLPTLPSRISTELAVNPFLRCTEPGVRARVAAHADRRCDDVRHTFAALRQWKDNF